MTTKTELLELEKQLNSIKSKKAQLDSEAMRHEIDLKNAKESIESSLNELKGLGFETIKEAEAFLAKSTDELKTLLTEAQNKIDGITTE